MISRKQFYIVLSGFIIIFIVIFLIAAKKEEFTQGDKLLYENNIVYTTDNKKYTGKAIESEGFKAKINDKQITKGFINLKNGELDGKFEFSSLKDIWNGSEVKGRAKKGKIVSLTVKSEDGTITKLSDKIEIQKYFLEKSPESSIPESIVITTFGLVEVENEEN